MELGVTEPGTITDATHTQDLSTLTLADHDAGQVGDKFKTVTPLTDTFFQFKLTRTGLLTVDLDPNGPALESS